MTGREERKTIRQRVSIAVMTAGVGALLVVLVGAFVLVPVFLVQSSRRKDAEAAEADRRAEIKAVVEERRPAGARPEPARAAEAPKPLPAELPPAPAPKDAATVDPEGFIRTWLVLAPVRGAQAPFSGALEIHKSQIPNESRVRPKEGDRAVVTGKERVWQKVLAADFYVDFQKLIGAGRSDDAIAYAVCYVHAPQAMGGLKLQMGSNDQAKVYLNGAQLLVFDKTRTLAKDQNTANDVQLRRGENLLVFKVVNEKNDWQGCVRFTDRNNQPVRTLQISLAPQ